jgi:hypothetical protein
METWRCRDHGLQHLDGNLFEKNRAGQRFPVIRLDQTSLDRREEKPAA